MSADPHDMVVSKGVRYRVEDAKRLGIDPDAEPDVRALELAVAEHGAAEEAERQAAEQKATEEAAADEKAKAAANKGRTAQTKG